MEKCIYITGGASGIGKALARQFVLDGHHVWLFDRQNLEPAIVELRALLRPHPANAQQQIHGHPMDVSDADQVVHVFAKAANVRAPDIVIHCAGIGSAQAFENLSSAEFNRVIQINLIGSRNVAAAALPALKSGGHLVLLSSMAGLVGCYGYAAYGAAKHGVIGLAQVLRIEFKPKGIDVSVVCPPEVETPLVIHERLVRPKATESMKLLAGSLTLEDATQQIYKGIKSRRFMIIPGKRARWTWLLQKHSPDFVAHGFIDWLVARS